MVARAALIALLVSMGPAVARAQQAAPDGPKLSPSDERVRAALQRHGSLGGNQNLIAPEEPQTFRLGALTFATPDTRGQLVAARMPIGDIVTRAAHSVAAVRRRRAERAAHDEVVKALTDFENRYPR